MSSERKDCEREDPRNRRRCASAGDFPALFNEGRICRRYGGRVSSGCRADRSERIRCDFYRHQSFRKKNGLDILAECNGKKLSVPVVIIAGISQHRQRQEGGSPRRLRLSLQARGKRGASPCCVRHVRCPRSDQPNGFDVRVFDWNRSVSCSGQGIGSIPSAAQDPGGMPVEQLRGLREQGVIENNEAQDEREKRSQNRWTCS